MLKNHRLIPQAEIQRIWRTELSLEIRLNLVADMCRANALSMIKTAGSGHLGSSFSAMDIVTYLYYHEMNIMKSGVKDPGRDIYFSSKGHDVPGLYAILYSIGILPKDKILKLRRLGGLDGHPDLAIPGIEANSGSLGMGISKGRGMAIAKRLSGNQGRVFVLTGDGELQEGQIYEALQATAHQKTGNLIVIVDHNKVQSDKEVDRIIGLGDLENKFKAFGWHVGRCNGHDFTQLKQTMADFAKIEDQPKILIADTIKGKGISFMEHPRALKESGGFYRWHAGAPDDESFQKGHDEICKRISDTLDRFGAGPLCWENIEPGSKAGGSVTKEYVADAFGAALVEAGERRKDLIVLDADLAVDCRVRAFEEKHPRRFVENGIAEQDMVSLAGGLALQGYLPVVNSFAAFLASRANEQIYTNACEGTRIIYVCHYAGLIPAGPGKSHQSIRDISLLSALPDFEIMQPCNALETKLALHYCISESRKNCVLRLIIGPSPRAIDLPAGYQFSPGRGAVLAEGRDAVLFAYGPVMLNEALTARENLQNKGFSVKVINMPWLNQVDAEWLRNEIKDAGLIYVIEDHSVSGGLGNFMLRAMMDYDLSPGRKIKILGVEGFPACGTPAEVLRFHGLDGAGIAGKIFMDITGS